MGALEFHPQPSPHFSCPADLWESIKAKARDESDPNIEYDSRIAGQRGSFYDTPVYTDGCPWDCTDREASG